MTTITETEINIMKEASRVHLRTPLGMKQLKDAVALQKEWREITANSSVSFTTATVKPSVLHTSLSQNMKKVKIIPIGINNNCHSNSFIFAECGLGFTTQFGFNMTACPCGKYYTLEIHTLNKRGDEYYDFTKDFNNEKEKWFIPLETTLRPNEYIKLGLPQTIKQNRCCRCRIHWKQSTDPRVVNMTTEELFVFMVSLKTMRPKQKCYYCDEETECRDRCGLVPICDDCEEDMTDDVSDDDE